MPDWVTSTLQTLGYQGIVGLMFVENVFPPSRPSSSCRSVPGIRSLISIPAGFVRACP